MKLSPFQKALMWEERMIVDMKDRDIDVDLMRNSTMLGPTRWFWVPQKKDSIRVPTAEPKLIKKWKALDLRQYRHEQKQFVF